MEKLIEPYDKEYMRMEMLKHEETFKQQVYELHRLYRIQKLLMRNAKGNRPSSRNQELWGSKNGFNFNHGNYASDILRKSIVQLDLERAPKEFIAESSGDRGLELMNESEIELTLGPTIYNRRKKPEASLTSDSGPSFSSSSTGSSNINRTSSLTHQTIIATKEEISACQLGRVQVPDMALGYRSGSKNSIDVEEQLRQERLKQPPWLFQVLSLNMT